MCNSLKLTALALLIALVSLAAPPVASAQDADNRGLFINLTTDDTWSAAKAIYFAHQRVLANGHPVAIWLNVRAVYLADASRLSDIPGPMVSTGASIQDMLRAFIADGGVVIMCAACSAAASLTEDEFIDGVIMGTWPVVEGWLFNPHVTTLAW